MIPSKICFVVVIGVVRIFDNDYDNDNDNAFFESVLTTCERAGD